MKQLYKDTHPIVEEKQYELLKVLTTSEHLKKTLEMSSWLVWLSRKAIAKAHPQWSTKEIDLFFVEIYYGEALARKLKHYLEEKT